MTIYNYFIVSNFNYCPLAWHFCSASITNMLGKKSREGFTFHQQWFQAIPTSSVDLDEHRPLYVRRMKQMISEVYKIVNDIAPDYIKDLINIKVKLQFQERKSGKSSSCEEHKVWSKVILLWSRPNLELSSKLPEAGWVLPSVQETAPCMGWWHQFNFNSLALPLPTSFCFSTPPFSLSFALLQRLCFFGVSARCNLNVKILNLISYIFSLAVVQCPIVLVSSEFDGSSIPLLMFSIDLYILPSYILIAFCMLWYILYIVLCLLW